MKYIKLSEYAKDSGISYMTAFRHYHKGIIPNCKQLSTGTILVGVHQEEKCDYNINVAIYCRVSSNDAKDNLERQKERLVNYAISKGYNIKYIIKEISSGMNDNRPKLNSLLEKTDYNILIVEHKDRLTRFGFNYIKTLLNKENKIIEVVNNVENDNENLIQDLISIIYSFSARLYGKRNSKIKTKRIIEELKEI